MGFLESKICINLIYLIDSTTDRGQNNDKNNEVSLTKRSRSIFRSVIIKLMLTINVDTSVSALNIISKAAINVDVMAHY